MNDANDIKELLNAYIDGELSERRHNEIKRLIDHDPEVAVHFRELERTRLLISSLPEEPAPEELGSAVLNCLERKMILDSYGDAAAHQQGQRHLYMRKLATVAAMFFLFVGLGVVVFQILRPVDSADIVAVKSTNKEVVRLAEAGDLIKLKLSIETDNMIKTAKLISGIIYSNLSADSTVWQRGEKSSSYRVACSADQAMALVNDLQLEWQQLNNPTLLVDAGKNGDWLEIKNASPDQLAALIAAPADSVRTAKAERFAALDNSSRRLETKHSDDVVLEPVKPRLTSGGIKQPGLELKGTIEFEIVIVSK